MSIIPGQFQTGTVFDDSMPVLNDMINAINDENQTKIIRNGTTPTVLIGRQKGGFGGQDYGIKIAKSGIDVTTATDAQLAFSSAFDTLRVVQSNTGIIAAPGSNTSLTTSVSIPHNLGYAPVVIAYFNYPTGAVGTYWPSPFNVYSYSASVGSYVIDSAAKFNVDSTNINFFIHQSSTVTAGNWSYKYYLLQETAV
jgi:hypothetical protein